MTAEKDDVNPSVYAWLKVLGIVATIAASSVGSYEAAKSDSKAEASASYATVKEAVERLESNQKVMWDVVLSLNARDVRSVGEKEGPVARVPVRVPLRPLPRNFDELVSRWASPNVANQPGQPSWPGM